VPEQTSSKRSLSQPRPLRPAAINGWRQPEADRDAAGPPIGNAKVDDSRIDYSSTTILLKRLLPLLKKISL
jgi:hypothetical protein